MANIDGGHYFLTTLMPLRLEPVRRDDGSFTSPSHLLREALATLPTAQQSAACVAAGFSSPFSRCTRTHFVRAVVIDQPMYNGRDAGNTIVQGLRNTDLLAHEPVDNLSCPYLMFCADFDARADEADGGLASWSEGLWQKMHAELRVIFASCLAFDGVTDGRTFHTWLQRCQIETTMSFNDYYVPAPDLDGDTMGTLKKRIAIGTVAWSVLAACGLAAVAASALWMLVVVPLALAVTLVAVLMRLWQKGSRPFPVGADTDLPSVLKALHVQQRFAILAGELQGADPSTVHARFGRFVDDVRPGHTAAPTQPPGVIRSDGVPMVQHTAVVPKRVAT